ncbi:MAG TPA: RNA polymerase sigma factor [Thermoanaerobaculia bacterium]|nr:RNA polymerase sigma factor [Thermoanaerobaculia bacterium]
MKNLSDQELMKLVQAGDVTPAAEIFDRYSRRIYNFAYRFLRNPQAAEDATQEVFVKMIRSAQQFQGDAKLSTWLFSITANLCRDHLRKADNKPKESEEVLLSIAGGLPRADEELEAREDERRVQQALLQLTAEQREAILLSRYQGLSYAEIAKIAGCSEGAVKTRVFRAMETLKKVLAGEAGGGRKWANAAS